MLSSALRMQRRGLSYHLGQQGVCYSFGGVRFRALTPNAMASDGIGNRGLAFGTEHALEITVDVRAFKNGLPKPGATITSEQGSHLVSGVNHSPGAPVAIIQMTQPVP